MILNWKWYLCNSQEVIRHEVFLWEQIRCPFVLRKHTGAALAPTVSVECQCFYCMYMISKVHCIPYAGGFYSGLYFRVNFCWLHRVSKVSSKRFQARLQHHWARKLNDVAVRICAIRHLYNEQTPPLSGADAAADATDALWSTRSAQQNPPLSSPNAAADATNAFAQEGSHQKKKDLHET